MFCDFCNSPTAAWCFPAEDHEMLTIMSGPATMEHRSDGGWSACGPCADDIESGPVAVWFDSVMARFQQVNGFSPDPMDKILFRSLWSGFEKARVGSRLPLAA